MGPLAKYLALTDPDSEKIPSSRKTGNGAGKTKLPGDVQLWRHEPGQLAKRVNAKVRYFRTDPAAALDRCSAEKDTLRSGKVPAVATGGLTIKDICKAFRTSRRNKVDAGELTERIWLDLEAFRSELPRI
jgi:hypothetical protein